MNLFISAVFTIFLLAPIQAAEIAYDTVVPFPQTKPTTIEYAVALKFKPQLIVRNGCFPYPAVDADGNTNKGLSPFPWYWSPKCNSAVYTPQGSQVYGRAAKYKGLWAFTYAWYFPRDFSKNASITAVSALGMLDRCKVFAPPDESTINGTSVKLEYKSVVGTHHYLTTTTSPGLFQDLVMWEDMTEEARSALETTNFNNVITSAMRGVLKNTNSTDSVSIEVPMIDANFLSNLEKGYPKD